MATITLKEFEERELAIVDGAVVDSAGNEYRNEQGECVQCLVSIAEYAKIKGVSRVAILKQINTGKVKAFKVGRAYVINLNQQ